MPAMVEKFAFNGDVLPNGAWHGIGTSFEAGASVNQVAEMAFPFTLEKKLIEFRTKDGCFRISDQFAVVRSSADKDIHNTCVGVVGKRYHIPQPLEALQTLAGLTDYLDDQGVLVKGDVDIETAGSLDDGRVIFAACKVRSAPEEIVPGDLMNKNLIFVTAFDGTMPFTIKFTTTLPVCMNTVRAALGEKRPSLKVKNTVNRADRIQEGKRILGIGSETFARFKTTAQRMAETPFNGPDFYRMVENLLGVKKAYTDLTPAIKSSVDNLVWAFEKSPGQDLDGRKDTAWGALNAVTFYTSHIKPTKHDRALFTTFGQGDTLNDNAFNYLNQAYSFNS